MSHVKPNNKPLFTFHYVSIKSRSSGKTTAWLIVFTFHYVSIKSDNGFTLERLKPIYIPLCIY